MIINGVLSISSNTNVIIALMLAIMIFLGCFMDMGVLIFVTTPILYPLAMRIGINPYHFGVMLVFGFAIGLCTPPVGTSLFLGCKIGKIAVEDSIKAFIPFYVIMLALLLLFAYVPEISLCLPRALGLTV